MPEERILPTGFKGWATLIGVLLGIASGMAGATVSARVWLLQTIETTHTTLNEVDRHRAALLRDIALIDKVLEDAPEGDTREALLSSRIAKYAELDRLNGLEE